MASNNLLAGWVSLCLLLLVAMPGVVHAGRRGKIKETNIVFYMQDWETGKNVTAFHVAGLNGTRSSVLHYGTIIVLGDDLTEGPERNSTKIGEAHGIYANSAMGSDDLHLLFSAVFQNEKFNGSTLEIQGADRILLKQREVSIVSGTGAFRYARGYATLETVYLDLLGSNAVVKFNVTVFHR